MTDIKPCCNKHDRMDMLLHIDEYNNFLCGSPTNRVGSARLSGDGGPRYCCQHCPTIGQVVPLPDGAFVPKILDDPAKADAMNAGQDLTGTPQ